MPRFIVTGNYTAEAMRGMIGNPSDREAVARSITEAAGGTLETYYVTTGAHDFAIKVTIDDASSLIAALMAAGASGAVTNLQTVRAFTSEEFTEMQTKAAAIAASYSAPN